MEDMITLRLPREDVEAFLRVVDDIKLVKDAEKGDKEIDTGNFKTLDQLKKKYIREKVRINQRFLDVEQRLAFLQTVCNQINDTIQERNKKGIYHEEVKELIRKKENYQTLRDAADKLKNDQDLSDNARQNIRYFLFGFTNFIKDNKAYKDISPDEIDRDFIRHFIKHLQAQGLTGKTINSNYLWAITAITKRLVDLGVREQAFETKDFHVKQRKNETGKYPPLTNKEMQKVFDYYREWRGGHYCLFLLHIYYTCFRPGELHRLQTDYFNFKDRTIFIPWFSSKNGLSRHVQILEPLYNALIEKGIHKLPRGIYLFGRECKPSKEQYSGHYSSNVWFDNRERVGLPIEKQAYGLKHTFNSNYINNNKKKADWEWLRRHNRHATIQQTQEYISGLTAYFLDETKSVILDYHSQDNSEN